MKLVGIDTNIILRLIVDDDPQQRAAALSFGAGLGKDYLGFLSLVSVVEVDWALRSQYGYSRSDVVRALRMLIRVNGLTVEHMDVVLGAIAEVETSGVDLADAVIALRAAKEGAVRTMTFDRRAARKIAAMELLT